MGCVILITSLITILAGIPDQFGYNGNSNDATQSLLNEVSWNETIFSNQSIDN